MAQVDYSALDDPNISTSSFYPRQGWTPTPEGVQDYIVNVGDDIGLSCRFFPYGNSAPTILFFYGNGETAIDYDSIAPMYNQIGLNFFVADYRGYGKSGGSPSFTTMLSDANTVLEAMRTSEDIVANEYVADGLRRAGQQINAGENLSEAFQNLGMFPPLVVRMLRVGESTGALDTALLNITYFYNRDVNESVDKALKLLEPTLTLVLGSVLALILFSVLTPLYDMLGQLDF